MRKLALIFSVLATASAFPAFASPAKSNQQPNSVRAVTVCITNYYPDGTPFQDCHTVYYYDDQVIVA